MTDMRVGVVCCSDGCASGETRDLVGQSVVEACEQRGWFVSAYQVCPQEAECVVGSIAELADLDEVEVALTVGAVGVGAREVTPDATEAACDCMVSGLAAAMNAWLIGRDTAFMLTRATAGIRGRTLVVNLPGDEDAAIGLLGYLAPHLESAAAELGPPTPAEPVSD